ncbi:MAG: PilZ domain-containing protein, partial [Nitrospinota bacterium]
PQEHVKKEAADEPEEEPEKLEKPGNYVFCAFKLPGKNRSLEIRGKIVRCKPLGNDGRFDLGVAFLELNEFQAQEIGFFLM